MNKRKFKQESFKKFHPGGMLGKSLLLVKDIMHKKDKIPLIQNNHTMREVLLKMTSYGFGCVGITNNKNVLIGIVTDGDLRRNIAKNYIKELKNLPIILPMDDEFLFKHSWHLFIIKVSQNYRDDFIKYMSKNNIGTSVHYIPIHMHKYYKSMFSFDKKDFPNSYQNFMSSVSIPIYESLTLNQQLHIIKKIKEFF